ncbi:hydrogenase expression/formation protein HypE [Candidatus Sumerlaeota bacterium]|nr:hydrogenase expression/formation protein HypE [Candidatus Sumerlaeota bacterium]
MSDKIVLAHGGGGALMRELIEGVIAPAIGGLPDGLPDASPIPGADGLVLTTDSFVVKPLFFRGGDIGRLSVFGTVNDLAVSGAEPLALSLSLIVEEGLDIAVLRRVVESAAQAARECGVRIVTGDTKVVARGEADELFVTTAGVGSRRTKDALPGLREGDAVLVSGGIAEHGIAVVSEREGMQFETPVESDAASVWPLVRALIDAGVEIHAMRDPTRGGLAACCVELADVSNVSVRLDEAALPIRPEVAAACEMLGFDPLTVANEGKLVVAVRAKDAEAALAALRSESLGARAAIIGEVTRRRDKPVYLRTRYGGERIVEMPYGEELPRIC